MRPNFKNIDIKNAGFAATNAAEWAKANGIEPNWNRGETCIYKRRLGGYGALELCFRSASLSTWPVQRYVRYASLDNPSVRGFLYR